VAKAKKSARPKNKSHPGPHCYCKECTARYWDKGAQIRRELDEAKGTATKAQRVTRLYRDHPPKGTAHDQTDGFTSILCRLYEIEDAVSPVGPAGVTFAEARAICERFLPPQLVRTLRERYG
jgi:hypothetical protein